MPAVGLRGISSRGYFGGGTKPNAPTITASSPGNGLLSISFDAPVFNGGLSITRYEYSVSTDGGSSWSAWALATSGTTPPTSPVTISGLTNGQSYSVKIRAVNNLGGSDDSNIWTSSTTPRTVPSAPTISSLSRGFRQLTIAFSAPASNGGSSITDYEYSKDNGTSWTSMGQSNTNNFVITSLSDFTEYSVRVRAVNIAGSGSQSAAVSAYTAGVPSQPTSGSAGSNGVYVSALTWTAPDSNASAISDYVVQWSTSSNFTSNVNTFSDGTSTNAYTTVTGLGAATTYYFRVAAVNQVGQGAWSSIFSATTAGVPSAPGTPSSSSGDQSFTISWSAPSSNGGSAVTGYKARVSSNSDMSGSSWEDVGNVSSKTWTGLTNGTTYYGQVLAYNAVGDSSGSGVSTGRMCSFAAPALSGNGDYASSGSVGVRRITWSIDPTNTVGSSTTRVYVQWMYADSSWSTPNAVEELIGTYTSNSPDGGYATSFVNSGNVAPGEQYRIRAEQTDGNYTASTGWINIQVIGYQTQYYDTWVYLSGTSSASELVTVTGTSFTHTYAASIGGVSTQNYGDIQHRAVSVYITSYVGDSGTTICTSSRYWGLFWSGDGTSGGTSGSIDYTGLQSPWSNNSGSTQRSATWDVPDTSWGAVGGGRVSVKGFGTISTWSSNPDQRIRVRISVNYERRQWTQNGGSYSY